MNCDRELGVPLEWQQQSQTSSQIEARNLIFLSRCDGKLGVAAKDSELLWSFVGNSGFILCCSAGPRVTIELWWGMQCASQVAVGLSLELPRGNSSLAGMCRMASVLQQSVGGYSLVLAWIFSLVVVGVNSVLWWIRFSLVVLCKILYSCGVNFISISSRGASLYV